MRDGRHRSVPGRAGEGEPPAKCLRGGEPGRQVLECSGRWATQEIP